MKLEVYLSNLFVLNQKLHNLHWNVEGPQFKQVHVFTEEIYDELFAYMDTIAEFYRMKGERPLARIEDYLKKATIKEVAADRGYSVQETLEIVAEDLEALRDNALEAREEHEKEDDFVVVNELEDHVAQYNKHIWFVNSMLGRGEKKSSKKSAK